MTDIIDMMDKPKMVQYLLDAYGLISVHLDARGDDVIVPSYLKTTPHLMLDIGYNLPVPIRDLVIDEKGICATLSFSRQQFFCVIPWSSIFAIRVEYPEWAQLFMWKNDTPQNVKDSINNNSKNKQTSGSKEQQKPPHLKVVK